MSLSAIILAAGFSSRMGRPKALLKWKGKTFLENICVNLEKAGVENIVIVTNKSNDKECRLLTTKFTDCKKEITCNEYPISNTEYPNSKFNSHPSIGSKTQRSGRGGSSQPTPRECRGSHLSTHASGVAGFAPSNLCFKHGFVINPNPEQGMLSSFRCGLRALESLNTNVMLCLTDHPAVKAETYKSLIENAKKNKIIIPKYNDRRGHPVIFGADFISELLENDCPEGARTIVRAHSESVKEIYVDDSGILLDIDTPEDAEKAGVKIII